MRQYYYRHELYDKMVDEWELFENYTDFFIFAAVVGYATTDKNTVKQYNKEYYGPGSDDADSTQIHWDSISNQQSYRVISASIAYQHTNHYDILTDPSEQLDVLARYARAGVNELNEEFGDYTKPPRDGIISYVDNWIEVEKVGKDNNDVFNEIIESFDQDIFG